ncbi:SH3 domain-containing protein [Halomonas sp. 18H]|nr:SH3 domain-containing protein [Halomonas sp. 18H]MCW4153705.1 SH3 domain-containing protein [Halomonas sp. 18H]
MQWKKVAIGLFCLHTPMAIANYEKGVDEYQRGNFASALYEWRQSAEQGDPQSQFRLAEMYQNGKGTSQSQEKAHKWYTLSADSGHLPAQMALAEKHLEGEDADPKLAARWYERAAEAGDAQAQFRLGLLYLEGKGVEQNDSSAAKWLEAAAKQGVTPAQNNIGSLYENGRGVEQDPAKAVEWYEKAAKSGDAYAQNSLGAMYAKGKGVEKNHAWAVFWFTTSAQQGNQAAVDNIDNSLQHLQAKNVRVDTANIRAGNSTQYDIIAKVQQGNTLRILGSTDGWSQVYLPEQSRLGWIASNLLE